jgi:hypothetical protein
VWLFTLVTAQPELVQLLLVVALAKAHAGGCTSAITVRQVACLSRCQCCLVIFLLSASESALQRAITVAFPLQDCLLDFLMLMSDPDRHVRKAAVVALSAVVHHKPGLVAAGLEQLLPLLYDQTEIKPEMVRELPVCFCVPVSLFVYNVFTILDLAV